MFSRKTIAIRLCQFILLYFLSYGMLYFSYKFYVPDMGGNDFYQYCHMYEHPLDMSQTVAPFIYRQFSAVVTNLIYNSGLYYPAEVAFDNPELQKIFFSAILSNYIALTLAAFLVILIVDNKLGKVTFLPSLIGGILCYLAFNATLTTLTGLTEGWGWFFVALCFLAIERRSKLLFALAIFFSCFQREVMSLMFVVFAAVSILLDLKGKDRNYYLFSIVTALFFFILYVIVRKVAIPVSGFENQLDFGELCRYFRKSFPLERSVVFQGMLTQNIFMIFVLTCICAKFILGESFIAIMKKYSFVQIFAVLVFLFLVSMATNISNNAGRIMATMTPVIASRIVLLWHDISARIDA